MIQRNRRNRLCTRQLDLMVNTNNIKSLHKRIESISATPGRGLALTSHALSTI